MTARIVVVGAGAAGLRTAERLRELRFDGDVVVVGAERTVVVGIGAAGFRAAEWLRECGFDGVVVVVGDERRCAVPSREGR